MKQQTRSVDTTKWFYSAAMVAVLLGLFGACSSDREAIKGLADGCLINTDCSSPLVCAFRKCHQQCKTSRDCSPGQRCLASDRPYHVCQLGEELKCSFNSDCPPGEACGVDLQCRDQCEADRDCVNGQVCAASTCAEPAELVDGGLVAVVPEAGTTTGGGQPCVYSSTCPIPLVCRNKICAPECVTRRDCSAARDCMNGRCVSGSGDLIGAEGGVVIGADGKIKLTIPAGALAAPVSIQVFPLDAWPKGAVGPVFEIAPSGTRFNVPATLTYSFDSSDLGTTPPRRLQLANAVGSAWIALTSTVDEVGKAVSAPLAHLSIYGLIDSAPVATDAGLSKADSSLPRDAAAVDGGGADTGPVCMASSVANALADQALLPSVVGFGCGTHSISAGTLLLSRDESCADLTKPVSVGIILGSGSLCGDFDVQVTFSLKAFSHGPVIDRFASLRIATDCVGTVFCPGMTVERYDLDLAPSGQPENYKSYGVDPSDNAAVFVPGADVDGRFRITRTGATFTGYYFANGGWVRLNQVTASTDPVVVDLSTGSCGGGQDCTGQEAQSVSFSNLVISVGAGIADASTR